MSLLIVDLDGTVRYAKNSKFPDIYDQYIYPEALKLLRQAKIDNWKIAAATNQGGIEEGFKALESCKDEIETLAHDLLIDVDKKPLLNHILFCQHYVAPDVDCWVYFVKEDYWVNYFDKELNFRKPNCGMLTKACQLNNVIPELGEAVIFIGDRDEDRLAVENFNKIRRSITFIEAVIWRGNACT